MIESLKQTINRINQIETRMNNIYNSKIKHLESISGKYNQEEETDNKDFKTILKKEIISTETNNEAQKNKAKVASLQIPSKINDDNNTMESTVKNNEENGSKSINSIIQSAAKKYGVDENLVRAMIEVESGYNPAAVSSKGAMGLMQLMPGTADDLGVSNPFNAEENIDGGTRYLSGLLKKYQNNIDNALGAYNAGTANVDKHNGVPPFPETKNYIAAVKQKLNR